MTAAQVENVRRRPGMWVGDTGPGGVLHLVLDVIANAFDQYLAASSTRCSVAVASDGTITVEDDGAGIAAEGGDGLPPLHVWLTEASDRPTVDGHRPHAHLGIGSIGLFVVNALSERFEVRSVRSGREVSCAFERGVMVEEIATTRVTRPSGTTITFRPDRSIFPHSRVPRAALARSLEDLAFLAPRWVLAWTIAGDDLARAGLAGRVALAAGCGVELVARHAGAYATSTGPVDVHVAIAWRTGDERSVMSYANFRETREHGEHVRGLEDGLREFLGGRKQERERGLVAAVSVVLVDVAFGSPTRSSLVSEDARRPVAEATIAALEAWARAHPERAAAARERAWRR